MKPCGFANCPNEATTTVRIAMVGDRPVCASCVAFMDRMGMAYRTLEANAFVPQWRRHSLARDMTERYA